MSSTLLDIIPMILEQLQSSQVYMNPILDPNEIDGQMVPYLPASLDPDFSNFFQRFPSSLTFD
jgi:hypothetical protein